MFKWFGKEEKLSEKLMDKFNKLPVPQEIENAAKLYYESSKGSLREMSNDDLCGYILAERQTFIEAGKDRTEETFYKMFDSLTKIKYNLDLKWE